MLNSGFLKEMRLQTGYVGCYLAVAVCLRNVFIVLFMHSSYYSVTKSRNCDFNFGQIGIYLAIPKLLLKIGLWKFNFFVCGK